MRRILVRPVIAVLLLMVSTACVSSSDPDAPAASQASATVTSPGETEVSWPLRVSRDRRHLETTDGTPFLMVADTSWALMTGLAVEDAKTYIDVRKEQGFNTILTNVVFPELDTPGPRGTAFAGGDFRRPSEAWFAGIDEIVAHARAQGVLIGLGTLWLRNYAGTPQQLPPHEVLHEYGHLLGSRYADSPNVFFFVGGDDDPAAWHPEITAMAQGIKAGNPDALITFHSWGKAPQVAGADWLDIHSFQWNSNSPPYSYEDTREVRGYRPARPVLDMEPAYDPLACCGDDVDTSELEVRRNGWWAVLSGALGVVYGGPRSTWNVGLETGGQLPRVDIGRPAARQAAAIGAMLRQGPWWMLEADWDATTVVGDRGTYGSADYVTAARATDGTWIIAYTPVPRTLQVDLSRLRGPGIAQWFDPATGEAVGPRAPVPSTGTRSFPTPLSEDGVLMLTNRLPGWRGTT